MIILDSEDYLDRFYRWLKKENIDYEFCYCPRHYPPIPLSVYINKYDYFMCYKCGWGGSLRLFHSHVKTDHKSEYKKLLSEAKQFRDKLG